MCQCDGIFDFKRTFDRATAKNIDLNISWVTETFSDSKTQTQR